MFCCIDSVEHVNMEEVISKIDYAYNSALMLKLYECRWK